MLKEILKTSTSEQNIVGIGVGSGNSGKDIQSTYLLRKHATVKY